MDGLRPSKRRKSNPLYSDYALGSIVRIKLVNFVTYDYCELFPGPYLNLIIGPNGTGKSTIVSAICIGLGWPPKLLGRAKEAREFIKYGKNTATIEIEMKYRDDETVTITRQISQDKSSSFSINREACATSSITSLMDTFNVQLNNLCHFLPQDRVAEFAQLDPYSRLMETERAIDHEGLLPAHEKLIDLRKREREILQNKNQGQSTLNSLKDRQQALEKEVNIFKEREKIKSYIEMLGLAKMLVIYREKTNVFNQLRADKKKLKKDLKDLVEEFQPILDKGEELRSDLKLKDDTFNDYSSASMELNTSNLRARASFSNFMENEKKLYEKVNTNRTLLRNANLTLNEAQQSVKSLTERQGPRPSDNGVQDLQEKMQEVNAEKLQHENEKLESSHELGSIRTLKAQKLIDLDNIKRELSYYNDATKRKLDFMSSAPGWEDAYQTYQLLKEYESAFEAPAYGPIYMNLKCKEKGFAALIEGFFRTDTFRTFIMSNYNDYLKLMDLITSKTKYTPTIREFSSERKKKIEDFEPPCSREKLQSFGFDGYVIDFLEGPEVVLVALCHMLKIHQIPIAKRELPPASVNALNNFRLANGDPVLKTYLAGSSIHLVFRSAYGDREITRRTDPLPSRSIYFSENVEMDLVKQKEEQLNAQLSQLENLQNEERKLQEKVNEHESLLSRTNDILSTLRKERDEKLIPIHEWQQLQERIEHQTLLLRQREKVPEQFAAEIEKNEDIRKENFEALMNSVLKVKENSIKATNNFEKMLGSRLNVIEAKYKLEKHEMDANQVNARLTEVQDRLKDITDKLASAREDAMSLYGSVVDSLQTQSSDRQTAITELNEEFATSSEVDNKISIEETKLKFMNVNSYVMEQYDARKKEIEELESKMSDFDQSVEELQDEMNSIKEDWVSKLEENVQCISDRFSKGMSGMGYAGEVRLGKSDDYDKWYIDILVQFREEEGLQKLTGQRQSGGERSVSTIMYLLSLQGLAIAPFRIVDEINQGMDPRNERVVHRHIVNSVCDNAVSQYFLVTPKLLPDLTYHRNLKVLCICNGAWLPATFRTSLSTYFEKLKKSALISSS
ncbi:hypothetical protein POMI540_1912 [Schizosaccharomyces pombe]